MKGRLFHYGNARYRAVLGCVALFALSAAGLKADAIAYAGLGSGVFGTIDLTTGAFTVLGNVGLTPAGLGVYGGSLYAESYDSYGTLYQVNPTDGVLTTIGSSGVYFEGGFGSTLTGLYGLGYASGGVTLDLFSINPSNGAATDLGSSGLTLGVWRDLSTNSSTLYFGNGADLYTLNTTNGSATLVGPFGDFASIGALVTMGGVLYGGDQGNGTIDTINTSTGAATIVSGPIGNIWGLAPYSLSSPNGTPEPGSVFLLAVGIAGLMAAKKKVGNR